MDPTTKDAIAIAAQIVGIVAAFFSVAGILFAITKGWWELTRNTTTNQHRLWLDLRTMLAEHDRVHVNLRPKGKWHGSHTNPNSEELPLVEAYMGLLEHLQRMVDDGLLDDDTYQRLYAYRIKNIVANPVIVKSKLIENFHGWEDFLKLVKRSGVQQKVIDNGANWLTSEEGKKWLSTRQGQAWLQTEEGLLFAASRRWHTDHGARRRSFRCQNTIRQDSQASNRRSSIRQNSTASGDRDRAQFCQAGSRGRCCRPSARSGSSK